MPEGQTASRTDTIVDKLEAMNAFVKVVALGSYAKAGRALGLTRSAVSKAVMELEQLLGARLLDRTTRRVGPTEAGLAYFERCADILARVEETELQVSRLHSEPRGVLRVNAPMSFGALYLGPAIADFMGAYPALKIELTLTDRFIDPIEEGVDVTIRIAALSNLSLIARRLAPSRRRLVAAPSYLKRRGAPRTPDDLKDHECLSYGHTPVLQRWHLSRNGEAINVPVNAVLCSNNGDVLRAAAICGRGIALLPSFIAGPDIAASRLQIVMEEYSPPDAAIHALYAPNRYLAAKTRVLIDFLAARFGDRPVWDRCGTEEAGLS